MAEVVNETVTTQVDNTGSGSSVNRTVEHNASNSQTARNIIYFIFGILEILLGFRFVLKLLGANPASDFVSFIYAVTAPFVAPFTGIFRRGVTEGIETTSVLEPATIVAMIVYALVAWGIVKLVGIFSKDPQA